jgi:hypothetical protein
MTDRIGASVHLLEHCTTIQDFATIVSSVLDLNSHEIGNYQHLRLLATDSQLTAQESEQLLALLATWDKQPALVKLAIHFLMLRLLVNWSDRRFNVRA